MAERKICAIEGCEKSLIGGGRGWCRNHYLRWHRHGDPLGGRHFAKECSVEGCDAPHKARGYCSAHYDALRRHGDIAVRSDRTAPGALVAWLRERVSYRGDDCLEWPFARYPQGYGHALLDGRDTTAHRAMCILAHGEPPDPSLDAAHSCHNRACCNPNHVRWATKSENQADRFIDGTAGIGEMSPTATLTEADVRQIRALRGLVGQAELAQRYGTTKSNVSAIQLRKSWRHVD